MTAGNRTAIDVRGLTIRYGSTVAVHDLSFQVARGTIGALLGPNGAGKTSTVEVLEGFRRPASGTVEVLGRNPVADHDELVKQVGVMLQQGGVYTSARPPEVLRLFASYYDEALDPDEVLDLVGLRDQADTTWRHLSGGEQQRLSLGLALIGRPELVFLDEPTAGIDPAGRRMIRGIIADLRSRGVTVVLTTHDLDEAEKLADHVVIIDHGHLLAEGTPAELMSAATDDIRFSAVAGLDVRLLAEAAGAAVTETAPGSYRVAIQPTAAAVASLTQWMAAHDVVLHDLRAGRQTLEDVFLRLTSEVGAGEAEPTEPPSGRRRRRGRNGGASRGGAQPGSRR